MWRRLCVAGLAGVLVAGCGGDEAMRSDGARAARDAGSEVRTVRVVAGAFLDDKLWSRSASRMVSDAETALGTVATKFDAEQPTTPGARVTYDRVSKALDDAQDAVVTARIALGNDDRAGLRRALGSLDDSAVQLGELGELAR
jgi:hypothetical protein